MSQLPVNATGLSRRELRKAVIRLRLEMQRQQLRRESQLLVQPFRQAQGLGHNLSQQLFGGGNAALWGAGGAALLGVLLGKGGRWQRLPLPSSTTSRAAPPAPQNAALPPPNSCWLRVWTSPCAWRKGCTRR